MVFRLLLERPSLVLLFGAVASLVLLGCSGAGAPPGSVSVSGTVTLDGKPVDQAAVAFIGNEGARLATASTDNAGKFTIQAALGKNVVTVAKESPNPTPASDAPQTMPSDGEYQRLVLAVKSAFPSKYGDPKTSGISFDVTQGMKPVEVVLSSK
jgi:hypothetical protein